MSHHSVPEATMFQSVCLPVWLLLFGTLFTTYSRALLLDGTGNGTQERVKRLEDELQQLRQEMLVIQSCSADFCDIHWSSWTEWGQWSQCQGQCTQGYGSSEQTRTRTRKCLNRNFLNGGTYCSGSSSETDKRPCNAVELYGCLNGANTNRTNGVYGMAYNFLDELAQSTCTAALTKPAHAAAVRRNCYSGHAAQCSTICSNLGYSCFDELHVYHPAHVLKPNPNYQTDEGVVGLSMFRYFSCTHGSGSCGPNYCCCQY